MVLTWNSQLLDKLIAPGISTFTQATIPDLTGRFSQADHWVGNFFLNSIFRGSYSDDVRQLVLGFLRRAQLAITAYNDARDLTLKYLDGMAPDNPRLRAYYAATARWENFAIESSILLDIFRYINGGQGAFVKGDRSLEDRLYHLANKVKHIGDDIRNKGLYGVTDSVALWLSDAGLNGIGVQVTYTEAAGFLEDVAKMADEIQDPLGLAEKAQSKSAAQTPDGSPSS
jgi:hypothetical protein